MHMQSLPYWEPSYQFLHLMRFFEFSQISMFCWFSPLYVFHLHPMFHLSVGCLSMLSPDQTIGAPLAWLCFSFCIFAPGSQLQCPVLLRVFTWPTPLQEGKKCVCVSCENLHQRFTLTHNPGNLELPSVHLGILSWLQPRHPMHV